MLASDIAPEGCHGYNCGRGDHPELYDLRREPEMRKVRDYVGAEFWPESFDGFWQEIGMTGDKNRWFRQVYGYWEMAAAR